MKRILFITNYPSPYRVAFYDELGKNMDVTVLFADRLEKASIDTIESGIMPKELYVLSSLENKKAVYTTEFLAEIASRL